MSNKAAFISAAGWKRSGEDHGLGHYPEPFLPLGDGTTTLYRAAKTFSHLGFDIYIAMAPRGYKFSQHWPMFTKDSPLEGSPWIQERFDYASQLGTVIEVPDPGRSGSSDTFYSMLRAATYWDRVVLARGDMLIRNGDMESILNTLPWPSQYQVASNHAWFLLDQKSARAYMRQVASQRRNDWKNRQEWGDGIHRGSPDGHPGTGIAKGAGIIPHGSWNGPTIKWIDIDTPETYRQALGLVADGTFIWKEPCSG